jgi:glycosyltransferase involved in cell wall biosynthesis
MPAEVLLINDASRDDTAKVLTELSSRFSGWIKVLELPQNCGPSTARNTGWSRAAQPYIAFLDADDSWHPQKIEVQYQWMAARPEVCLSSHRYIYGDTSTPASVNPDSIVSKRISFKRLLLSNLFSTPNVMLRRDIPERFRDGKRYAEDYLLWLSIAAGHECHLLDIKLTYLHKAPFGASGLSADMWYMERGELAVYNDLYEKGLISVFQFLILVPYSLSKFMLRLLCQPFKGSRLNVRS